MSTTIFTAATIITMDAERPRATAVAVRDKRIVAVGTVDEVTATVGDEPFTIDETHAGDVILPGLIDQHLHPILGATTLATEVIATEDWVLPHRTYPAANGHDEYLNLLRDADQRTPDGEWLFSWGYHRLWHGELSRQALDMISADRPIGIWQRSCHEFFLNSAAIRELGLSADSLPSDPAIAATIDLERGHFMERGFFVYLSPIVGKHLYSIERLTRGLEQMVSYLHLNGVTAFNEPGAILVRGGWQLYEQILGHDDTPFYSFFLTDGRRPAEQGLSPDETFARAERDLARAPDGKLAFFPKQVKLFADGAIISQLMQMRDPYLDANGEPNPNHHGEWIMPPEMFRERFDLYWQAGYQIHVHVNGDLGLDLVLDTLDDAMKRQPRDDHRTVIVHFANSTEDQVDRIAELGAIVSSNPYYPVGFADKYGEVGLGPERADVMTRNRSVVDRGIPLSFHSDLPMGRSDPLAMMSCAVNRVTNAGRVAGPEQRITAEQALRAVTIDAAQSWRKEHELGSIEVNKIANFTVVDADPLTVDSLDLDAIAVRGTVFEGRWFPVDPALAGRLGAAASRHGLRSHLELIDGDLDNHRGCICSVAAELMRAIA